MHLAASVRIVGPGPSGNRPLDPVLQRRAATSVVGLCGTPSTSIISGVGCAETRGSLQQLEPVDPAYRPAGGDLQVQPLAIAGHALLAFLRELLHCLASELAHECPRCAAA